jgi:hypothetical protein
MNYLTIYNVSASIGTSFSTTWTYAQLGAGIENMAEALNEIVQQYHFINDGGWARNHVTGAAPAWTFSGRRVHGDEAQDYIFSKKYKFDTERETSLKVEWDDKSSGTAVHHTVTVDATICNPVEFSGNSTDDSAISFEIRFDGAPTEATA